MLKKCDTHEMCISSDSNLPTCKCWCAECKENRQKWQEYNNYIGKKYGKIPTITEYFKV